MHCLHAGVVRGTRMCGDGGTARLWRCGGREGRAGDGIRTGSQMHRVELRCGKTGRHAGCSGGCGQRRSEGDGRGWWGAHGGECGGHWGGRPGGGSVGGAGEREGRACVSEGGEKRTVF